MGDDYEAISRTLQDYLNAYVSGDLDAAVGYYDFPYTLVERANSTVFTDGASLRARFATMRQGSLAAGHCGGEWQDLDVEPLGDALARITAKLAWRDAAGRSAAAVDLLYLMRRVDGSWKIVVVVPFAP